MRRFLFVLCAWLPCAALLAQAGGAGPAGSRARGVQVTFQQLGGEGAAPGHTEVARVLSLAVERGEAPTPFVAPGWFRASYRAVVTLPLRERYRFRIEGRGSVTLRVNGEPVLDGSLRAGKPLESKAPARLRKGENDLELVFESAATGEGQFRLFWAGPDFGFEPPAPEALAHNPDDSGVRLGAQLRLGQQLFVERRCARCHANDEHRIGASAFGELDQPGPDLRQIGGRVRREWLVAWLRDPRAQRPDATMPKFALGDGELGDLAAWLAGLGTPPPALEFEAAARLAGERLFQQLGCVACHTPPAVAAGRDPRGPVPLHHVPQKWHAAALVEFLQQPARDYPHTKMPDFRLARDEAMALAAYLLAGPATPVLAVAGDAARGRRLAQRLGCAVCHALDQEVDERRWPRMPHWKVERGCLAAQAGGRGAAPDHELDPDQSAALRAFLPAALTVPFRSAPADYAARQVEALRCTACHGLDGTPSAWANWAERASATTPLPAELDPRGQGVPALTWVGSKLQPSWLVRFVQGQEKSPRPWLTARMPAFHRRGEIVVQGLVRQHGYGALDEPLQPPDAQAAIHGERLVQMGTGFGCVQCHALGDQPAVQVFERAGIDLLLARTRLRHEYYVRWLMDPPRIDPDARMPKYRVDGERTAIQDVLGGAAEAQFEAIWHFLGSKARR